MADTIKDDRQSWQNRLESEFSPEIDSSLIAALIDEPRQTFDSIHSVLCQLQSSSSSETQRNSLDGDYEEDGLSFATCSTGGEMENVQRALEEWKLVDAECDDPENLRLTDEEDANVESLDSKERREAIRIGDAAGRAYFDVEKVASGHTDMVNMSHQSKNQDNISDSDILDPIAFLVHAFPSRTPAFLREMYLDEEADILRTVDTLMTLELVESGVLDEDTYEKVKDSHDQKHSNGLLRMADDDDTLMKGTGHKKVTKRDRQRRKAEQAQLQSFQGSDSTPISQPTVAQKVNLTDVRKGAPSRIKLVGRMNPAKSEIPSEESDAEFAARLAREERLAAGLPEEDQDDEKKLVKDNDWLFSSSILEQLSLLLDIPNHKVKGVHAACHMNLRATLHRLINMQCIVFASLQQLDQHNDQPEGTSGTIVDGLSTLLLGKSRSEIERLLRATGGREDAVLDLSQLADRIESNAVGERTDILDPMKHERTSQIHAPTLSLQAGHQSGHFDWVGGDTPLSSIGVQNGGAVRHTPYASVAHRQPKTNETATDSRHYALQRLREGASSITFPLNSAQAQGTVGDTIVGPQNGNRIETAAQAAQLAQEYSAIAQEYRIRRQESLTKAARSYRSTHNTAISKGPMRGAAAWVYAEEARRLDAKARAFALQAAQATVRSRMLTNKQSNDYSIPSNLGYNNIDGGNLVDLHGVTVHQSLTITRQALDSWWSKSPSYTTRSSPLHIVTGVGRHSRGQIALVRPAILAMLQREQWNIREPQQGHILVLSKR